ncbi:MAG TPA: anti-sigma factor [Flavisolibacter sp.]|nr:anti-sigma factor [Flavisolibacter sp.]
MNVKEYISSGIIESYVLGLATDSERQEFESLCAQYPEIAEARNTFELQLEEQLLKDAAPPPTHLKQVITEKLAAQLSSDTSTYSLEQPEVPVRKMNPWKWVAAASLLLMAGAAYWGYTNQNKYKDLQAQRQQLESELAQSTAQLEQLNREAQILHNPDMKTAAMQSTTDTKVYGMVYWDSTSSDVYLLVNNMPQTASDKQYQLWALLDNQPIDLGLIELKQQKLLIKMKNVRNAQAFAITVEPKGGSPVPTSTPIVLSKL